MIAHTYDERDAAISKINAAGNKPVSFYLSDIKAWLIGTEGNEMQAIAREKDVIQWAKERGIFEKATPDSQFSKTCEEIRELGEAIALKAKARQAGDHEGYEAAHAEVLDAIGDSIVTLIIQAGMHGLTAGECLESAYRVIKDRKGRMIDGQFVKEAG